jgi:hypothetical protein
MCRRAGGERNSANNLSGLVIVDSIFLILFRLYFTFRNEMKSGHLMITSKCYHRPILGQVACWIPRRDWLRASLTSPRQDIKTPSSSMR